MDEFVTSVLQRQRDMERERYPWEWVWQEIHELMLPRKADVTRTGMQVYRERRRFDATAMNGNERLAAAIVGTLTPQTMEWFDLQLMGRESVPVPDTAHRWAQQVTTRMHEALQQSNFAAELEETLLDMGASGTGCLFVDQGQRRPSGDFGGLMFQSWAAGEYWIAEGPDGVVNRVHRMAGFTAEQMVARYGLAAVHDTVRQALVEKKPLKPMKVLQAMWRPREGERVPPKAAKFPVANIYVDVAHKHVLGMGGFYEFPAMVGRWRKTSAEVWGRGPGMTALPDVQVLNEADKLGLQAWSNQILPPLVQLHEGVIGAPDLRSLRVNTITERGALDFLVAPTNVNADLVRRREKQAAIREIFFMDQVQFLPERGKTPPTAAEVQARLNIMLQILGPTLHRFEWEVLQPLINRVFQVLLREHELPAVPPEVEALAHQTGGRLAIRFTGPIARARQQADGAAIDNFLTRVLAMLQYQPDLLDVLDGEALVRHVARLEGVPHALLRTTEEVATVRRLRSQAFAQQPQTLAQPLAPVSAREVPVAETAA